MQMPKETNATIKTNPVALPRHRSQPSTPTAMVTQQLRIEYVQHVWTPASSTHGHSSTETYG